MAARNGKVPERRSIWRVGPESTWTTVLPVAFIILSLISLVILPIAVSSHTQTVRNEITRVAEPARISANQLQIDLSSELDKIIAFQVTGQAQYRADYERLVAIERHHYAILRSRLPLLGDDLAKDMDAVIGGMRRWHQGVGDAEFLARQLPEQVFLTRLYERHPSYETAIRASSELQIDIQQSIDDRLGKIRRAESLNITITIVLTLLALTSAMLVAGLGRQMWLLAREAMRRRQEAEREASDAKLARAAAEREERRAAFLAAAGQELTASLDYAQTIATLAKLIVPNLAEVCAIDLLDAGGSLRREAVAHRDPEVEHRLRAFVQTPLAEVPEALADVMKDREPRVFTGEGAALLQGFVEELGNGHRSIMAIPLVSRGQFLGIVTAGAPNGKVFTREDAALAAELTRHASLAIDNARLYLDAQQALRAREEVLAIVSHDLRNPLNAITLATSLLKMIDGLDAEAREQLDIIDLSAKRMNRLIADLLDITRLEGGKRLPVQPARVEIEPLLRETHELFKAQAAANDVRLEFEPADGVPPVWADRDRVTQVLSNLIGNALKFTPAGGAIRCGAEERDGEVVVIVSDTGPGIPPEHLEDIFNPYWQAKRTERLGAGLGLPIAKGIVEAHGGRIWVTSEPGNGTTFRFTLPVARSREESPAPR